MTVSNKADRIVAERAQKQRHIAKLEHRRKQYRDSLDSIMAEEKEALMKKHGLHESQSRSQLSNKSRSPIGKQGSEW